MLKAAVIGGGMISTAHCVAYSRNPECTLVAIAEPLEDRRTQISQRFHVKAVSDYRNVLADDSIDIVSVCTPDHTHADIAVEALHSGKHVILEKPMAVTLEDCDRIIDAMKSAGRYLTVDFEYRFNPFFRWIKNSLDEGSLGELKAMSIYYWRHPFNIKPGAWIYKRRYTTMMVQEGCHYLDLFRWICGEVENVYAWSTSVRNDLEFDQVLFGELSHQGGRRSQYAHTIIGNQIRHYVWLIGTKGVVNGEMIYSRTEGSFAKIAFKPHKSDIAEDIQGEYFVKFFGETEVWDDFVIPQLIDDFLFRISNNMMPTIKATDGRSSIELALALEESAITRKEVKLPLDQTPKSFLERMK